MTRLCSRCSGFPHPTNLPCPSRVTVPRSIPRANLPSFNVKLPAFTVPAIDTGYLDKAASVIDAAFRSALDATLPVDDDTADVADRWPAPSLPLAAAAFGSVAGVSTDIDPWFGYVTHKASPEVAGHRLSFLLVPVDLPDFLDGEDLHAQLQDTLRLRQEALPAGLRGRVPLSRIIFLISVPGGRSIEFYAAYTDGVWVPVMHWESRRVEAMVANTVREERANARRARPARWWQRKAKPLAKFPPLSAAGVISVDGSTENV